MIVRLDFTEEFKCQNRGLAKQYVDTIDELIATGQFDLAKIYNQGCCQVIEDITEVLQAKNEENQDPYYLLGAIIALFTLGVGNIIVPDMGYLLKETLK